MLGIVTWLVGSQVGRIVALVGISALGVAVAVWRIYAAGGTAERARQTEATLDNLRERIKIDDTITTLPADERRKRLEEWASD
jgi:hypothetical protein